MKGKERKVKGVSIDEAVAGAQRTVQETGAAVPVTIRPHRPSRLEIEQLKQAVEKAKSLGPNEKSH